MTAAYLHELLEHQALQAPSAPAVLSNGLHVTFRELKDRADRVAAGLRALGVGPGDRVGVCASRSPDTVAAVFGILSAGCACVPLDLDDPAERRARILEKARASVVVGDDAASGELDGAPTTVVELSRLVAEREPGAAPWRPADGGRSLAFVFYTSGSTGVPKGVMLSHRALLSGQRWLQRTFPLAAGARQLLRTTLSVTNLVREVFWPVLAGGTIVVVPPGAHRDPERLVELVNRYDVRTLLVVPALLRTMLEQRTLRSNRSLAYLFCSSDAMPGDLPDRYFETGVPASLYNLYGLTEALYCSYWRCEPGITYDGFVPVGHAAELTPWILDDELSPVPDGTVGELCVSGVGIADGYDALKSLTAERFVETSVGRVYRTGDVARRRVDGAVELLGRLDDQVKVAGHRVELGEIEVQLRSMPRIEDAVVVGRRSAAGHQRLVGYLVASDGERLQPRELRAELAERLPEHMIPAAFAAIRRVPLTHNGKIDRASLASAELDHLELTEGFQPPRSELERRLCDLWAQVLELPRVGVHDNFFALGGDSIQGFLVSAAAAREGLAMATTQVFRTPTVAEMARALLAGGEGFPRPCDAADGSAPDARGDDAAQAAAAQALGLDVATVERAYPLTEMQQGMLFHSLLDPESGVYVEQFVYRLDGALERDAYMRAWEEVVQRHDVLRACIALRGAEVPLQTVLRDATPAWTTADWSEHAPAEQAELLDAHLRADRRRGFRHDRAPLLRMALLQTGEQTHTLILTYHHLILDAWSLFVMLRDSLELYAGRTEGRMPRLAPARSFGEYVAWVSAADGEAARAFWSRRLRGFARPTIVGRTATLQRSASTLELHEETRLVLGEALSRRLAEHGRRHRLTLNTLVQGAWGVVLARLSGCADVCFGITVTHRPVSLEGVEDLVGIFINSLPLRLQLDPDRDVGDWLQQVQREQVEARSHDHYPLARIQELVELEQDGPLFETLLIFENFPRADGWSGRAGIDLRQERYVGWTNYPFALEVVPDESLAFQVKYDRAFFDVARVEQMLRVLAETLEAFARADGSRSLGTLVGDVSPPVSAGSERPAADPGARAREARPLTALEQRLARRWQEVLGHDRIDVDTCFVAAGGTSLAAVKLVVLCQQDGIELTLRELFGPRATIRGLAARA